MTLVDLLSDTVYYRQAVDQLRRLLGNNSRFPVKPSQIYGLRQIARQEPGRVEVFANHQRERAERKSETASQNAQQRLEFEINFWNLVANLCGDTLGHWSVQKEGIHYLPRELRDENRREVPGSTPQETTRNQQHNNRLRTGQREWLNKWENEHIPAFFERFCTHCLFCIAKEEMEQLGSGNTSETDQLSQQEQNANQEGGAMQNALQQANIVE